MPDWRNLQERDHYCNWWWIDSIGHSYTGELLRPAMYANRGFTLVEMIAAIVVIGIIAAAGAPVMVESLKAYNSTLTTVQTLDKLRYATERMAREFREATRNVNFTVSTTAPAFDKTDYLISGATTTSISRHVAISSDSVNGYVNLAYTTGGATTTAVLTDQLSTTANSLQFAFWDQSGTTSTSVAASVRYVDIMLTLRANGQDYSSKTRVALQN